MATSSLTRRSFLSQLALAGTVIGAGAASAPAVETSAPAAASHLRRVRASAKTVVEIESGRLKGCEKDGVFAFKGIPYGAPTAGKNRFKRAEKPAAWTGVRNALHIGRACFPARGDSAHFNFNGLNLADHDQDAFLLHRGAARLVPGEDCLRVNVWTPQINGNRRRPVMVFMHGGGYESGFGSDLLAYDGENLARNDVVVVTHNHRLNVFGYLNLAEWGGEEYRESANVGLLDLVSALQWIQTNIHAFGGDPSNVTLFGQSGGGGKVAMLMGMPEAKGLFHKAIIQSGPFLGALDPAYSSDIAAGVLAELGLTHTSLAKIQDVSVDRLAGAAAEAMRKRSPGSDPRDALKPYDLRGWGPSVDGLVLPRRPFDPGASDLSADVPLLTGSIFHEGFSAVDNPGARGMTEGELNAKLRLLLQDHAGDVLAAYRSEYPQATPFDLFGAINAGEFRRCAREQALRKAALGRAPAYQYLYSWNTPMLDGTPGTFHACEIAFVFDNAELCSNYSGLQPEALALAKQVSGAWVQFARTGNPNHKDLPEWAAVSGESEPSMVFDTPCVIRNRVEVAGLEAIAKANLAG